jgi:hypothetical protein
MQSDHIQPTASIQFCSVFNYQQLPAFPSFYASNHLCLLDQSAGHLGHLPFPDIRESDQQIADKFSDRVELPRCLHCGAALIRGISYKLSCQPFGDRIRTKLPPSMDEQLLSRIGQLTHSNPNFPSILNRDLRPVLQHACFSGA